MTNEVGTGDWQVDCRACPFIQQGVVFTDQSPIDTGLGIDPRPTKVWKVWQSAVIILSCRHAYLTGLTSINARSDSDLLVELTVA